MMTVKHIEEDGVTEHVFQIESLDRVNGELVLSTQKRITSGKVYVMSEGKTVAAYDFTKHAPFIPKEQKP